MTKEVEVIIKPDGSSLAVSVLNSGMLEMGARVPRESDDVKEEILYQVAVIHQDMVSQRDELGRELLKLRQERERYARQAIMEATEWAADHAKALDLDADTVESLLDAIDDYARNMFSQEAE